ncbi:hypothetical protein [Caballeronia sp. GAFFF2]|uniref:hypothetical protein n=1 Tax=Caballeronia sp. GAFFF2 TaxID=2921741 RepID=UPI0020295726|nr:hypothetical protein [Caballeronia sp. GAFFF2]
MLKLLCLFLFANFYSPLISAQTFDLSDQKTSNTLQLKIEREGERNVVQLYNGDMPLKRYENLLESQSTLDSNLVHLVGGGVALEINSEGSRRKYHVIVPIDVSGGALYTDCAFKSVYDAVDQSRLVGTLCKKTPLEKFVVDETVNDVGLLSFVDNNSTGQVTRTNECTQAKSLKFAHHSIFLCSRNDPESGSRSIHITDAEGKSLISLVGFDFIPGPGDRFALVANAEANAIVFRGRLSCLARSKSKGEPQKGRSLIGGKYRFSYSISVEDLCLEGAYTYSNASAAMRLNGSNSGHETYLLETDKGANVTGLFILKSLKPKLIGEWISVSPKAPLTVD